MPRSWANWAQTIEDISTRPEFQNAAVVLFTPGFGGEYDVDTGDYTGGTDPVMHYRGQARVVGIRYHLNDTQANNPSSIKGVRLQIADRTLGRVPNDARAYFTNGGRNSQLTTYVFNVNSDFNSSQVAAYTFELSVDLESEGTDFPEFDENGDYVAP